MLMFCFAFGSAVASLGTNLLVIGAERDDTAAANAGCVYLFDTNGVLLTAVTNPTPEVGDLFGGAIAVVGPNKFIVGANQSWNGSRAGFACLYDSAGHLLVTITNPAPVVFMM